MLEFKLGCYSCPSQLSCCVQDALTIIALGDVQLALHCTEPVVSLKRVGRVRKRRWVTPQELSTPVARLRRWRRRGWVWACWRAWTVLFRVAIICIWSCKNCSGVKGGGIGIPVPWVFWPWLFCPCWSEPRLVFTIWFWTKDFTSKEKDSAMIN